MTSQSEERWHCMNPSCRREAVIETRERTAGTNPRCACGGVMKREYAPPVLRYFDVLQLDEHALAERASRRD